MELGLDMNTNLVNIKSFSDDGGHMYKLFHDGGPYHIETSPLKSMGWFLYDRDLCHERVKQHLSNIWSSIHEKVKQHWGWVEKKCCLQKNACNGVKL